VILASQLEPQHLADHPLVFAVPVLIPVLVVVVLVVLVVVRDRRRGELDDLDLEADDPRLGDAGRDVG
jgi:hypothetical protein